MKIEILITTIEQFNAVNEFSFDQKVRLYIESFLIDEVRNIPISDDRFELWIALPYVLKQGNKEHLISYLKKIKFNGMLIRNLEELALVNEEFEGCEFDISLDASFYIFNSQALEAAVQLSKRSIDKLFSSYELTKHELKNLFEKIKETYPSINCAYIVYGHIPMMISQNCVRKTMDRCSHIRGFYEITDRMNKSFKVLCCCDFCYNVIYNSVPLSLHKKLNEVENLSTIRIDFSVEDSDEVFQVLRFWNEYIHFNYIEFPYKEYTTGHNKRPVL